MDRVGLRVGVRGSVVAGRERMGWREVGRGC